MPHDEYEKYDTFVLPQPAEGEDTEDNDPKPIVAETNGKKQLIGYAVVFGAVSDVRRDGFRHRFSKGSIRFTTPTNILWGHDYNSPLASTSNDTAALTEDAYGWKCTIDLDETQDGQDAFIRVRDRLVTGMSFGGKRLAYDRDPSDPKTIDVTSFLADEVSITIVPAMDEAQITTSDRAKELEDQKTQAAILANQKAQQTQLAKARLTMLTAGRR